MGCFEKLAPLGKISAYIHNGQWFPTDTLEKYSLACQNFIPEINFNEKKVIIADVDDTICDSCQQISPEMAEQISKLISKGYTFAFISGSKCEHLHSMISSKINEEHHLLGTTGTIYEKVNFDKRQLIYANNLTNNEKGEIFYAFKKLIRQFNIEPITSTEDQLQDRDSQITLSALGRNAPLEVKRNYDPNEENPNNRNKCTSLGYILTHPIECLFGGPESEPEGPLPYEQACCPYLEYEGEMYYKPEDVVVY